MVSKTFSRLSGAALLLGGILFIIGNAVSSFQSLDAATVPDASYFASGTAMLLGSLLVALGLPAAYASLAGSAGRLGVAGYVGTMLLVLLPGVFFNALTIFVFPVLLGNAALASRFFTTPLPPPPMLVYHAVTLLLQLTGPALLGIAMLRATHSLSRWTGLLFITSSLDTLRDFVPGANPSLPIVKGLAHLLLFLAFAWLGYALVTPQHNTEAPSVGAEGRASGVLTGN